MKTYRNGWGNSLDLEPGLPELSADLEYILQSGQSDLRLVAEGLLYTYYAPVYRLCLVLEDNPSRAQELFDLTFAKAVNQAYRYQPKSGIPVWFYRCLLQAIPLPARRERRGDLPVLLRAFTELNPEQIALLCNLNTSQAKTMLANLEEQPGAVLEQAGLAPEKTSGLQAGDSWRQVLQQQYPVPELDEDALEARAEQIYARAEKSRTIRRRLVLVQELILLLVVALIVGAFITAADRLAPEENPTRTPPPTVIVTRIVEKEMAPVIVVTATATAQPRRYPRPTPVGAPLRLPPLSVDSSPVSILERLRISEMFWETVWAETITVLHGPEGYLGPDRIRRSQFWLSNEQARIQSGPLEGAPDEIWVGNLGRLYSLQPREGFTRLVEVITRDSLKRPTLNELGLIFDPLQPLGIEAVERREVQLRISGRDRIAGRETVVVELLDASGARTARLWLDTQTSFVLRHQQFQPAGMRSPAIETIVTRVVFNLDFENQAFFDLNQPAPEAPANDPLGRPSRALPTIIARANWESNPQPARTAPPQGFDPARSRLSFLYPPDFDLQSPEVPVDLFADDYFLGSVTFANPWWMICERSPDGRRIAAASRPLLAQQTGSTLYWLEVVNAPVIAQRRITIAGVSDLAFAPDSQRLAMLGRGGSGSGLYLVDLQTGELRILYAIERGRSLAWSPDGEQIALIGHVSGQSGPEELLIIEAQTGELVYRAAYSPGDVLNEDAPLLGWGSDFLRAFPTRNGGLEACSVP